MKTADQIMTAATAKAEKAGTLLSVKTPKRGDRKIIKGKWHEWSGCVWGADDHKISVTDGINHLSHYLTGRAR